MILRLHGGGLGPTASMVVCVLFGIFIILVLYCSYLDKLKGKKNLSFARNYLLANLWSTQIDHQSRAIVFIKLRGKDSISVVVDASLKAVVIINNNGRYIKTDKVTINKEILRHMLIVYKHGFKIGSA